MSKHLSITSVAAFILIGAVVILSGTRARVLLNSIKLGLSR